MLIRTYVFYDFFRIAGNLLPVADSEIGFRIEIAFLKREQ